MFSLRKFGKKVKQFIRPQFCITFLNHSVAKTMSLIFFMNVRLGKFDQEEDKCIILKESKKPTNTFPVNGENCLIRLISE